MGGQADFEKQIIGEFDHAVTVSASEVRNDAPPAYSATDDTGQQTEAPAENLRRARTPRSWIATCALAAGLVLGVLLAGSFGIGSNIFTAGGTLRAGGMLAQRLSKRNLGPGSRTKLLEQGRRFLPRL